MQQLEQGVSMTTAIDVSSRRSLAGDAGSCLANGACLYSRDELMRANAEMRGLSEGSFFARADVAAYQVDLDSDDIMQYLSSAGGGTTYLDGTYSEDGHQLRLRIETSAAGNIMLFSNLSSGVSKLLTKNGTWSFTGTTTTGCVRHSTASELALGGLAPEELAVSGVIPFNIVKVESTKPTGFLPTEFTSYSMDDCLEQTIARSNLSDPAVQMKLFGSVSEIGNSGNTARKLAKEHLRPLTEAEKHRRAYHEMRALMEDKSNEINQFHSSPSGQLKQRYDRMERELFEQEHEHALLEEQRQERNDEQRQQWDDEQRQQWQ
jgi:hypothetical protein